MSETVKPVPEDQAKKKEITVRPPYLTRLERLEVANGARELFPSIRKDIRERSSEAVLLEKYGTTLTLFAAEKLFPALIRVPSYNVLSAVETFNGIAEKPFDHLAAYSLWQLIKKHPVRTKELEESREKAREALRTNRMDRLILMGAIEAHLPEATRGVKRITHSEFVKMISDKLQGEVPVSQSRVQFGLRDLGIDLKDNTGWYESLAQRAGITISDLSGRIDGLTAMLAESGREDVRAHLHIEALRLLERYDPTKGSFWNLFNVSMAGVVKRYWRDKSHIVKIPRGDQKLATDVKRYINEGIDSNAVIAAKLGVPEAAVRRARLALTARSPDSLDRIAVSGPAPVTVGDYVGDDDPGFDHVLNKETVAGLLSELPPRERQIVELYFYDDLSQTEIAAIVRCSQMQVSRLLRRSLAMMAEAASGLKLINTPVPQNPR
jgi:RNA polymerase sigma-B factor